MYEITVYTSFLALMSTSLIILNFSVLQIPSDITTCCRPLSSSYSVAEEHFITLSPVIILRPARAALMEHQTDDLETEEKRRMREPGARGEEGALWGGERQRNGACL